MVPVVILGFHNNWNVVGHRGLIVMALDCGAKGQGFKPHPQILFLS